jgi:hypothetical protein
MRIWRGVLGAVIGAVPGLILVLLAEYVIEGEMQLTIGAPGFALAIGGALAGLVVGLSRRGRKPVGG